MGQARQRKAEIDQLKSRGARFRSADLYMCGWFYKACEPQGLNLVFTRDTEPVPGFVETIAKSVDECSRHSIQQLQSGKFAEFGGATTYAQAIEWLQAHTEQGIQEYNRMMYGTPTQPQFDGQRRTTEVDIEDMLTFAICLGDNITTLTHLGELPNDNQNGPHFAYVNVKL